MDEGERGRRDEGEHARGRREEGDLLETERWERESNVGGVECGGGSESRRSWSGVWQETFVN